MVASMTMPDPNSVGSRFPLAHCHSCDKTVLTCLAIGADGNEHRHCVHCDSAIASAIEWVDASELERTGYYLGAPPSKAGGCGCGSCAVPASFRARD
ncbi:MAG TPA: hypothetical protein VEC38_14960 [Candidatus Binataceae bacterium]|nr:hypothetical protein [Candidatus Binataceae bacterium]